MRLLKQLVIKLVTMVIMVVVMGALLRYAKPYIMKSAGMPEGMPSTEGIGTPHFSSEESDLMSSVFKGAMKMFTGTAKRDEVAGELTEKLYGGKQDMATMNELGIELVKPGGGAPTLPGVDKPGTDASVPAGGASDAKSPSGTTNAKSASGASSPQSALAAKLRAKEEARAEEAQKAAPPVAVRQDLLGQVEERLKVYSVELTLVPIVLFGMFVVHRVRMRRAQVDELLPAAVLVSTPSDAEPIDLKFPVDSLPAEDFEYLVALIYQRQGYRVSMPAGLSGGRGGDFTLLRKAERILVQCKKVDLEHNVPVERVRELHEAMTTAGLKRGMYVASCRFTWDARNFAKAKGITLINARTLDSLIGTARENPNENLFEVSQWMPKLISKVQITPPVCPACEAEMDEISTTGGSAWVCSQRPDCRGRRIARKYKKPNPAAARKAEQLKDIVELIEEEVEADGASQTVAAKPVESTRPTAPAKPADSTRQSVPPKPADSARQNVAAKPADNSKQVGEARPADGARKTSGIKQVDEINHPDPVRQVELNKLAEMARKAIQAKRTARAKQEQDEQAAQKNQPKPAASAAPQNQARQVTVVTPGKRATTNQPSQATPAPPGNRITPNQASQTIAATPGNRATSVNQASRAVPATPGNRPTPATPGNRSTPMNQASQSAPVTPGNRATPVNQARRAVPATPGNRVTPNNARTAAPATPGNRSNS